MHSLLIHKQNNLLYRYTYIYHTVAFEQNGITKVSLSLSLCDEAWMC